MAYFHSCPHCGANLDPGESCDCQSKKMERVHQIQKMIKPNSKTGQFSFDFDSWELGHENKAIV